MERNEFEAERKAFSAQIKQVCRKYGLYGSVIYYEPSPVANSDRNRPYIIAGLDPGVEKDELSKHIRPDEILRSIERNDDLFYPNYYAIDLSDSDGIIQPVQELVDYCKKAEFISRIYGDFGMVPPEKLRLSEVNQLIRTRNLLDAPLASEAVKRKAQRDLDWFFRREQSKGFRKRWLDYFRSGKFPTDKGPVAKLMGYFRRNKNQMSVKQLREGSDKLHKIEMQEFEFKLFQKFIRDCYPDVCYAAGDKTVVDHGLVSRVPRGDSPAGRPVTAEEYAVIRKDKFASEGWDAVSQLVPAYWEFRDVYYDAADEPYVASAYNSIVLQYAKCDDLGTLKGRGELCLQRVPADDFMNFVSLAKANKLRFYIDNLGDYAVPSLETINVLYNKHQQVKMRAVIDRLINDSVDYSHVLTPPDHPSLSSRIRRIDESRKSTPDLRRQTRRGDDSHNL